MSKKAVQIGVRIVQRPAPVVQDPNKPYQPPKKQLFKAIATCNIAGMRYSRTAAADSETGAREEAYSKLATLIARQGAVPLEKFGVESTPSDQHSNNPNDRS